MRWVLLNVIDKDLLYVQVRTQQITDECEGHFEISAPEECMEIMLMIFRDYLL
jgi:hypothetical protein